MCHIHIAVHGIFHHVSASVGPLSMAWPAGVHQYDQNVTPKLVDPKSFEEIWNRGSERGFSVTLGLGKLKKKKDSAMLRVPYKPLTTRQFQLKCAFRSRIHTSCKPPRLKSQ